MYTIEICANSAASCQAAQAGGASRVELCAGIPEGGTTPSLGEMMAARGIENLKLHVIVRPRAGDFLYTPAELNIMESDIMAAHKVGADGVVFGCLTPEGEVDKEAMQFLIKAAQGMSVTFHRAFDVCARPLEALEQIIALGCNRILTSGGQSSAQAGIPLLKELVQRAGNRIIIMPGCGINETNIACIASETGAKEFHLSVRENRESGMIWRTAQVSMGGTVTVDEYKQPITSAARVAQAIDELNKITSSPVNK